MNIEEARVALSHVKYKPGAEIRCWTEAFRDVLYVSIKIPVVLLETGKPDFIGKTLVMQYWRNFEQDFLLREVMHEIEKLEIHEAREWFSYKGERIFNPHAIPIS